MFWPPSWRMHQPYRTWWPVAVSRRVHSESHVTETEANCLEGRQEAYDGASMSFEPVPLALSVFVSFVGLALFVYGRRSSRMPQMVAGVLFMVYPYFTPTAIGIVAA